MAVGQFSNAHIKLCRGGRAPRFSCPSVAVTIAVHVHLQDSRVVLLWPCLLAKTKFTRSELDLGSSGAIRGGSSPPFGMMQRSPPTEIR